MKALAVIFILFANVCAAQTNTIAHFSIWKPKTGQEPNFEKGYQKHLDWHKTNNDKWSWYGWYVISGPRNGMFIDATFDHAWNDFDKPVNPTEDRQDVVLHVSPFGDWQFAFKASYLSNLSMANSGSLKAKYLRLITVNVLDIEMGKKVIEKLKTNYQIKGIKNLLTYKMVDGGNLNQFMLLIGFNSMDDFGKGENLQEDLLQMENTLKIQIITSVTSETLLYLPLMSLFAN